MNLARSTDSGTPASEKTKSIPIAFTPARSIRVLATVAKYSRLHGMFPIVSSDIESTST